MRREGDIMAEWITPVYDRTQEDVDFAMSKIAEWIANDSTLVYDLKGCLNASDINRIEGNISYLSKRLNELGYSANTSDKVWSASGLPTDEDVARIINNIREIITTYCQHRNAPDLPYSMRSFTEVNSVEKNIQLIKELLDLMVKSFKKSGTFQSGATFTTPKSRETGVLPTTSVLGYATLGNMILD